MQNKYDKFQIVEQLDKLEFGEVMDVCSNKKKMIAPIIITVIMVLYYVVYFGFLINSRCSARRHTIFHTFRLAA